MYTSIAYFDPITIMDCKYGIVNMTDSLSFWLQVSEPITHIDTDNYMTIHHKGTSYFDSTAFDVFCLLI